MRCATNNRLRDNYGDSFEKSRKVAPVATVEQ